MGHSTHVGTWNIQTLDSAGGTQKQMYIKEGRGAAKDGDQAFNYFEEEDFILDIRRNRKSQTSVHGGGGLSGHWHKL